MALQLSQVRAKYEASLLDAASIFGEAGNDRNAILDQHLAAAAMSLGRVLPRVVSATLALSAGQRSYAAPAAALGFHSCDAVEINAGRSPFDPCFIEQMPVPTLGLNGSTKVWIFSPAPGARFLNVFGSAFEYQYSAGHLLSENPDNTTLPDELEPLLILRAQVDGMRELAVRNAHKPVVMRDAVYSQTKNGTPAALADLFMKLYEQEARKTADTWKTFA